MHLKIEGGTASHSESSLCLSCRYATIVRGASLRDEIVECRLLSDGRGRIPFRVTFCNAYVDRTHPSIQDMEEIAWILRTDAKRNQVGFVRAKDLKAHERFVLSDIFP